MKISAAILAFSCLALPLTSATAGVLETVRGRGELICGTSPGVPGFSLPDSQGQWTGLDVDFCRALSAAIFNDPTRVKFIPLNPKDRFSVVQSARSTSSRARRPGRCRATRRSALFLADHLL
jgi:general L-amino acid transport system substrate-binding protein